MNFDGKLIVDYFGGEAVGYLVPNGSNSSLASFEALTKIVVIKYFKNENIVYVYVNNKEVATLYNANIEFTYEDRWESTEENFKDGRTKMTYTKRA